MKRFHKFFAGTLCACAIMAGVTATASAVDVQYYDSRDITEELLLNRTPDTLIIEKVVGVVMNAAGDGNSINAKDPDYSYISYAGLGFDPLDIVLTLETYNPNTQYTDDIITRQDFKIGSLRDFCKLTATQDAFIRRFDELPKWAQPEMREILDREYINGGTAYDEDPDDINMYLSDVKTLIVTWRMIKGN